VHCPDATASSFVTKVLVEVTLHFHAVAVKVTIVCGIDCLACQDEFFVKNTLDVKENDEHASWKSCSVSIFSTDFDSALITSVVSKLSVL
jgi:hypothetical protein